VAILAARITSAPVAVVFLVDAGPDQVLLRASSGPVAAVEEQLRTVAAHWRTEPGVAHSFDPQAADPSATLRFCAGAAIAGWDGDLLGVLLVAAPVPGSRADGSLSALVEMAAIAGHELELDRRRVAPHAAQERRKTQEQLLGKTLELAKFGEDLRQLHRLSTTNYASLDELFADYLSTGRSILGMSSGVVAKVRGRYAAVAASQSDVPPLRPGLTFELSQVYCGVVCAQACTVSSPWVGDDPALAQRAHYGPVRQACYIGTPIVVEDQVYGVLSFSSPHARWRDFSSHEVEIIELMAKGIARAVLETQMQVERRRAEELEQDRGQVLEMVAKGQPLTAVLAQIVRLVERQSPALTGAFHLVCGDRLFCVAAPGFPSSYQRRHQGEAIVHHDGCCLLAAITRRTEILEAQSPRCSHEHCWQACGATPIVSGSGELLGLLTVYWKMAVQPRHVDVELLEMAGALAAIAIEHRRITDRLDYQAHHDVLTGLPNRTLLTAALRLWLQQTDAGFGVVFVDLDRFKQINDLWGHAAGDAVLVAMSQRLTAFLRPGEIAARIGGDEFVLLLAGDTPEVQERRARALLNALREPIRWQEEDLLVTASIGLCRYPDAGDSVETLLGNADAAMYRVKSTGKNDMRCFAPDPAGDLPNRLEVEHALRRALERGEFALSFQPIWDIRSDQGMLLDGFEVLLTWQNPTLGRVSPAYFIPIAEECGQIGEIGEWVLRESCAAAVRWQRDGHDPIRVSVNVSALQFLRPDFVDTVTSALEDSGLPGSYLELEITESAIMENAQVALEKLERIRSFGVTIALDDFGTGYSSLSYLRWIPVDTLKIDRSFISGIDSSAGALTLVQTIVDLAHNMSLGVVAEGIEQETQLELLRGIHCDKAQGHLFGTALAFEQLEQWLESTVGDVVGVS
jgi:diguanylate cyclase (GGDEF)-like protein